MEEFSPYSNRRLWLWPWSLPTPSPCPRALEPMVSTLVAPESSLFSDDSDNEGLTLPVSEEEGKEEGEEDDGSSSLLQQLRMP